MGCGGSIENGAAPDPTGTAVIAPPATATSTPIETPTEASEPTPLPSPTIAVDPVVSVTVSKLLEGQTGVFGIVITRTDGTIAYQQNENTPFVMASLYKLVLLANIFEKRENGELSFDQEVELLPEYYPEPGDFADSVYDESTKGSTARVEDQRSKPVRFRAMSRQKRCFR